MGEEVVEEVDEEEEKAAVVVNNNKARVTIRALACYFGFLIALPNNGIEHL